MKNVEAMRKRMSEMVKECRELLDAGRSSEDGVMDEEQTARWNDLRGQIDRAQADIDREVSMQDMEMRMTSAEDAIDNDNSRGAHATAATENRFSSLGEQLRAVKSAATGESVHPRLTELRQLGLNEGVPAEGGFLVEPTFSNELIKRIYETGLLLNRCRKIPIGPNSNGIRINGIDETDRATGSRWGGVQAYWLGEGGTKTASRPSFRQIQMTLGKLIGVYYATDEILQDVAALESVVGQAFAEEMGWMTDNGILRGPGGLQPQGILNSNALVTVAPEAGQAATTFLFENVVSMWSRMWGRSRANAAWFINQDVEPQLYTMSLAVGTGGAPVFLPSGGASSSPYATLMGRPIIPIEQASTLGTEGDVILADLSQYLVIDKGGIQSASSIHVQFLTDESTFRFVYRVNGQSLWHDTLTPANGVNTLSPFVALDNRP